MPDPTISGRAAVILIANDQEWAARALESILAPEGYPVIRAYTGRQALELARLKSPDVVILDSQMPDLHGNEVCRTLRADPQFGVTTPIIITTAGPSGRTDRLAALRAGAWEFFGHPLDGEAVLLKIKTYAASKLTVDRLRNEGMLDELTGLYNANGLHRRAREIGSEAGRQHQALACVVVSPEAAGIDFEVAKAVELIQSVAAKFGALLRQAGRAADAIGRVGPLEFGVVAPATSTEGAVKLVERFNHLVDTLPIDPDAPIGRLVLRAGYCSVANFAESEVDAVQMLHRATTALRDGDRTERIHAFAPVAN